VAQYIHNCYSKTPFTCLHTGRKIAAFFNKAKYLPDSVRGNFGLAYVIRAMAEAGLGGIGPGRARLELREVLHERTIGGDLSEVVFAGADCCRAVSPVSPDPEPPQRTIRVELRTPLRLKIDGDLITPDRLEASHIIGAAVRRVSALAAFHAGAPLDIDYVRVKMLAMASRIRDRQVEWRDWQRYSARQGTRMKMGGIVGSCTVDLAEGAAELFPWLSIGQWVGAGKSASMGLGQYRVAAAGHA
ncbi:CRISPR system precrRNA processing endoribonuclease RAMP protein Cas6, partial [Vineibacter terrae]